MGYLRIFYDYFQPSLLRVIPVPDLLKSLGVKFSVYFYAMRINTQKFWQREDTGDVISVALARQYLNFHQNSKVELTFKQRLHTCVSNAQYQAKFC